MVPEYYHDFLDVFLKEASDKMSLHSKYDHKIELVNESKDHGQAALCSMLKPQLEFVKNFLEENPQKSFIEASKTLVYYQSYWLRSQVEKSASVLTIKSWMSWQKKMLI